jgi:hypothetical protein
LRPPLQKRTRRRREFQDFRLSLQAREFLRNFIAPRRGLGQSSNVTFICSWIVKAREPNEKIFAFPHWQRGKSVLTVLSYENARTVALEPITAGFTVFSKNSMKPASTGASK